MKLLLSSRVLSSSSFRRAFLELAGKPATELRVALILTAMHPEEGDKRWVMKPMQELDALGVGIIDIVEIAALDRDFWLPRLESADVIWMNGGDTNYLMAQIKQSGLDKELPRLLRSRLYVGVSAGSYVVTPDLRFTSNGYPDIRPGLGIVPFGVQAHFMDPAFPAAQTLELVRERAEACGYDVYAIDDNCAVKVRGTDVEVIGDGRFEVIQRHD